jgi:hypothetical protein
MGMEQMAEKASVIVCEADGQWLVRVVEEGALLEERFEVEEEAKEFALAHRTRLGLRVQPDVS